VLYRLTGPHTAVLFKAPEAPRAPDTPAGSSQIGGCALPAIHYAVAGGARVAEGSRWSWD
jgi:hypothetical protein